jgi:hypothetical protein
MIARTPPIIAVQDFRSFDVIYVRNNKAYKWTSDLCSPEIPVKDRIYAQYAVRFPCKAGEEVVLATQDEVEKLMTGVMTKLGL